MIITVTVGVADIIHTDVTASVWTSTSLEIKVRSYWLHLSRKLSFVAVRIKRNQENRCEENVLQFNICMYIY